MNIKTYPTRVKANLLPLSKSPLIHIAIGEWVYGDVVHDSGGRSECCELCDQERLRYQYLIRNTENGNKMLVGSSCILKFGVAVISNGRTLYGHEAKNVLDVHLVNKRKEISLQALDTLITLPQVNRKLVQGVREFIEHGRALSPKQLSYVAWQLGKAGLNHDLGYFKMDLKRKKYKEDFAGLQDWQLKQIWPALIPSQRKIAEANGYRHQQ